MEGVVENLERDLDKGVERSPHREHNFTHIKMLKTELTELNPANNYGHLSVIFVKLKYVIVIHIFVNTLISIFNYLTLYILFSQEKIATINKY